MGEPLRIILADDHILFRKGLEALLAPKADVEVVGEAGDGLEAVALAREKRPDAIFMDLSMPKCSGIEAIGIITREMPQVQIVVLTFSDNDRDLFEAIKAGAVGYMLKTVPPQHVYDCLDGLRKREVPLAGGVAAKILREFREQTRLCGEKRGLAEPLSQREVEVLEHVVKGDGNREIAEALSLTENTVKIHIRNILEKLHLANRVQAAVYAVTVGLVSAPEPSPTNHMEYRD